jgi:hypothetical protein
MRVHVEAPQQHAAAAERTAAVCALLEEHVPTVRAFGGSASALVQATAARLLGRVQHEGLSL